MDDLKVESTEPEIDLYGDTNENLENLENFTESEVLGTGNEDEGEPTGNGTHDLDDNLLDEVLGEGEADLFDDVLTESSGNLQHSTSVIEGGNHSLGGSQSSDRGSVSGGSGIQTRRYCCYVGNMTWWTTDADLADTIAGIGISDLVDVKFYENRANGQSKGFALAAFANDSSVRQCMEKLPNRQLHGQSLVVMPYTKQSLGQFEAATRRPGERTEKTGGTTQKGGQGTNTPETKPSNFMGTIRIGAGGAGAGGPGPGGPPGVPPMGMMRPSGPPMGMGGMGPPPPGISGPPGVHSVGGPPRMAGPPIRMGAGGPAPVLAPPPATNRPPPGFMPGGPNLGPPRMNMNPTSGPPPGLGIPPPGAHINPNVYPGAAAVAAGAPPLVHPHHEAPLSEPEFEEIMNRNRTVSSSAISRAVSDAAAGDYASAIETLVTAISLIRQSRVAHDDRCKVLITSLQDTLHGIEAKSYARRSKDRSRDRSRSRERSSKRHRRSRSRSRSRDRYEYSPSRHRPRY